MRHRADDWRVRSLPGRRWVLAAGALAVAAALAFLPQTRPAALMRDFNAFYCAGSALDRGADPYRAEPLGTCERSPRPAWLNRGIPNLVAPAPLPPYALAPFALLARLPYDVAAFAWGLVILAALISTVVVVRRMTALPLAGIIAAFVLGDGLAGWTLGQVAPIAVAAIVFAAALVERGRDRAAALAIAVAMIEPHVALPAALALFVWRPRARVPLLIVAAALAALSLAAAGWALNLEYVRAVLPAHALSEIASNRQLSLTNIAHRFGASDVVALRLGDLSYAVMVVAGVVAAPFAARRLACPALIVALPVACGLVGGPFAHVVQTAAALPCALLLYARVPSLRMPLGIAIAALAIPWAQFSSLGAAFPPFAAIVAGVLTFAFIDRRPIIVAAAAAAATLWLATISAAVTDRIPDPAALLAAAYDPRALAEASWQLYVAHVGTWDVLAFDLARLPSWLGLVAVAAAGFGLALQALRDTKMGAPTKGELHLDSAGL